MINGEIMSSEKNLKPSKLKKGKKGEKNILLTCFKIVAVSVIFVLQIVFMAFMYTTTKGIYIYARYVFEALKVITALFILYKHDSAAYKISWIVFILVFPVVGIVAYILWGNSKLRKKEELKLRKIRVDTENSLESKEEVKEALKKEDIYKYMQANYINKISGYPVYFNQGVEYFDIGENFFKSLNEDLKKAKNYIFIEFFIISQGKLWNETFEILKEKAKEGVEIKIIIDSFGSLLKKPKNFKEELEQYGIKLYKFNPFSPVINGYINYRDHRKIVVIDGVVSYTGGVNLADEYANLIERFGYWKDGGIKVEGEAAKSFLIMFLRNIEEITLQKVDYEKYIKISEENLPKRNINKNNVGFIAPFADGPDNRKNPIENIYIQTLNYAKKYVYMTTPYFIVSENILNAILNSARSGVDVRLIVPYIPDKKIVNVATKSYYEVLLEAGVKVYEYKPGFIHSKTFVSDDEVSIVGTANIDFRSMNLNFECTTWTYKTNVEKDVREDFENMLKECKEINLDEWKKRSIFRKMAEGFVAAFSPMM